MIIQSRSRPPKSLVAETLQHRGFSVCLFSSTMSKTSTSSAPQKKLSTTKSESNNPTPSLVPFSFKSLSRILYLGTVCVIVASRLHFHHHVDPEDPIEWVRPFLVAFLITGAATIHHFFSVKYVNEMLLMVESLFDSSAISNIVFALCVYLQCATFLQLCSNGLGVLRDVQWRLAITRPASVWLLTQIGWFAFFLLWRRILVGRIDRVFTRGVSTSRPPVSPFKRLIHAFTLFVPLVLSTVGLFHTISPIEINNSVTFKSNILPEGESSFELKLFQLSDMHLGTFMSQEQLHKAVNETLTKHPDLDLVLLTGDFYTVESSREETALSEALTPLKKLNSQKNYQLGWACPGNHDHDVALRSKTELDASSVQMLVDQQQVVNVKGHKIQIIGLEYRFSRSARAITDIYRELATEAPEGITARIVLLHNPSHFKYIVPVDTIPTLVLSGHLHGGQFGLRSFPIPSDWTILQVFGMPDFGFYYQDSNGRPWKFQEHSTTYLNELDVDIATNLTQVQYVHSGTGFYGLPLRIGTQSERGIMTMRIERLN